MSDEAIKAKLDEHDRMLRNWRGRRFLACRAADTLASVAEALGDSDGSELPPPEGLPVVSDRHRAELSNMVSLLLRLLLIANDGSVSPQKLQRF